MQCIMESEYNDISFKVNSISLVDVLVFEAPGQLLSCYSVFTFCSKVRHLGHLCEVVLNVLVQKGIKQQPATQLQKKGEPT